MSKNPSRYWLVHGFGPANCRHETYESAAFEAKRLARLSPGETFTVLEAVKAFRKVDVEEMAISGGMPSAMEIGDGIPF